MYWHVWQEFKILFFYSHRRRLSLRNHCFQRFLTISPSSAPAGIRIYFFSSTWVKHVMRSRARIWNTICLYPQKTNKTEKSLFPAVYDDFDRLPLQLEESYFFRSTSANHVRTCRTRIWNNFFLYSQKTIKAEGSLISAGFDDFDGIPLLMEWSYIFFLAL